MCAHATAGPVGIVIRRVSLTQRGEVQSGSEAVTPVQSGRTHRIDPPLVVAVDKDMGATGLSHDAQACPGPARSARLSTLGRGPAGRRLTEGSVVSHPRRPQTLTDS